MKKLEFNALYCMDCLDGMKYIDNDSIDLIVTDPPYSLEMGFENDNLSYSNQKRFMDLYTKEFYRILKPGGTVCIFSSSELSHYLYFSAEKSGFVWQNDIIWNRDRGHSTNKKLGICHESIYVGTKGEAHKTFNLDELRIQSKYSSTDKRLNPKGKNPGDVWYIAAMFGKKLERLTKENGKAIHPTQKPIDIIMPLILLYSNPSDIIFDAFSGVGTTWVACKRSKRNFLGFEISEYYCKEAKNRLLKEFPTNNEHN